MENKYIFFFYLVIKNIFIPENWIKPKNKDIIIYDCHLANFLLKYINKKNTFIFHNRMGNKNCDINCTLNLNFYLIFKLLKNGKLNLKNYKVELIKSINPKFIFTLIDNNSAFYHLKKKIPEAKTIIIQTALRYGTVDFKKVNPKDKGCVDHTFVLNIKQKNIYSKYFKSKFREIGSIRSNSELKKKLIKDIDFLYIAKNASMFEKKKIRLAYDFDFSDYFKKEVTLLKNLSKFLKKKNIKINLLAQANNPKDKIYYDKILGSQNYNYITNYTDRSTLEIVDRSKIICGVASTLLFESLSRLNKTMIFSSIRNEKLFGSNDFHLLCNLKKRGKFWSNDCTVNEIKRLFNFVNQLDEQNWARFIKNKKYDKCMKFSKNNKVLRDYLKKIKCPIKRV